jgi:hypothetical protein
MPNKKKWWPFQVTYTGGKNKQSLLQFSSLCDKPESLLIKMQEGLAGRKSLCLVFMHHLCSSWNSCWPHFSALYNIAVKIRANIHTILSTIPGRSPTAVNADGDGGLQLHLAVMCSWVLRQFFLESLTLNQVLGFAPGSIYSHLQPGNLGTSSKTSADCAGWTLALKSRWVPIILGTSAGESWAYEKQYQPPPMPKQW